MDSFPQPPNRYLPPPAPPSMGNPHFSHHHQPPPPPSQRPPAPPPIPPQGSSWFSGQFQYHPSHSHSPSPPLLQPWGHLPPPPAPPHSDHLTPYHPHQQGQYPPPSQMAPPPHSHVQAYPVVNQDWGNTNWPPYSGWDYPAHGNEEDWAAKARAWAAARAAMDNQHPSVQSQYPGHCHPSAEPHYQNNPQTSMSMPQPSYENFHMPTAALMNKQMPLALYPEPSSGSSGNSFYGQDGSFSYGGKDGKFSDAGITYLQQEGLTSPSVHKQEVPSSYSSAPGKQDTMEGQLFTTSAMDGSSSMDQTPFPCVNQSAFGCSDPRDQPLEFTQRINHDNNPKLQPGYSDPAGPVGGMDSVASLSSFQPWMPPVASNSSFSSVSPAFPSAPQQEPIIGMSPLSVQPSPMLGRVPGPSPNFPPVPSVTTPMGLGAGTAIHPTSAFPGDLYGASMSAERPKKAAVPDWLRDEIIKKRDVIASSGLEHLKEEDQSFEDEPIDKSIGKSVHADSKSVDSSRSTDEEDDDEDEVVAAKTAAINREIKRILTEVLLKVTTDLFDEIATRVLSEDDPPVEADQDTVGPAQKISVPLAVSTAKVLIPVKPKEHKTEDASEKSSSGAAGNVLGLANYASDEDDDDDEIRSSNITKHESSVKTTSSGTKKHIEENRGEIENGHMPSGTEESHNAETDHNTLSSSGPQDDHNDHNGLSSHRVGRYMDNDSVGLPHAIRLIDRKDDVIANCGRVMNSSDVSIVDSIGGKVMDDRLGVPIEDVRRRSKDDFGDRDSRRHHKHESQRSFSRRDSSKELDSVRENEKGDEIHGRQDGTRHKKEIAEEYNGYVERSKDYDLVHGDKTKEVDSGKRSPHHESKEDKKEMRGSKRASDKDDTRRKREQPKDENDNKHRHRHASDISRSKRRRSSSISSRDRNIKDKSFVGHSDDSNDEASEDSRRKVHLKRHNLSPSPDRSRGRRVSRSPPSSKVSQRRHSPYSSLGSSRRRRSRSRSPARRRR